MDAAALIVFLTYALIGLVILLSMTIRSRIDKLDAKLSAKLEIMHAETKAMNHSMTKAIEMGVGLVKDKWGGGK